MSSAILSTSLISCIKPVWQNEFNQEKEWISDLAARFRY